MYIYQHKKWPNFSWDVSKITSLLASVRHKQGKLTGRMSSLGFDLQEEAMLQTITQDVLKTSEIEGEYFNTDQVRSSVARKLGMDIGGAIPADRHVEEIVDMLLECNPAL